MNPFITIQEMLKSEQAVLMVTRLPAGQSGALTKMTREIYAKSQLQGENYEQFLSVLQEGKPRVIWEDEKNEYLWMEPFFQKERLIVFGGGHIAIPLVKMAAMTGFRVTVVDDRPSFANTARFLEAEEVICDDFVNAIKRLDINQNDFLVVITRGHRHDEICLREILKLQETIYTGMIGSKRRVAAVFNVLKEEGFDADRLGRICSPIGLSIGSVTPEEISISILAQVIQRKRKDAAGTFLINRSDMETELIAKAAAVREPAALVSIMETHGSAPRNAGAKMIVYENGRLEGSVGGGCSEAQVMHTARQMIKTGRYQLLEADLSLNAEEEGMVCGGTMKLFIEDFSDKAFPDVLESVEAVILAAGYSSRAGSFKMELDFQGKPMLLHVVEAFLPFCDRIFVVGGYQYERLIPLLAGLKDKVELVYNKEFDRGMFSSVQEGVSHVTADRFFLTPGDYPLLNKAVIQTLLDCEDSYVIPSFEHHGGHPILLPFSAKEELLSMEKDSNLKVFLKQKEVTYLDVTDQGVLQDLDTREDYERLYKIKEKESGEHAE